MIIDAPDAQYLQKHGDMIFRNSDTVERAQGYLIEIPELGEIVQSVIKQNAVYGSSSSFMRSINI